MPAAKFDQSVDLSFRLGVDPKHADQMVRGAVVLSARIGKTVRVAVFAKGEKEREAREAGADVTRREDLVERVQGGWMEFDTAVATPTSWDRSVRLGKVLGPRGSCRTPKLGTVTFDVTAAVREAKAGKVEFRVDKAGNIHTPIGKHSFGAEQLAANGMALIERSSGQAGGGEGHVPPVPDRLDDDGPRCPARRAGDREPLQEGRVGQGARSANASEGRGGRGAEVAAERREDRGAHGVPRPHGAAARGPAQAGCARCRPSTRSSRIGWRASRSRRPSCRGSGRTSRGRRA